MFGRPIQELEHAYKTGRLSAEHSKSAGFALVLPGRAVICSQAWSAQLIARRDKGPRCLPGACLLGQLLLSSCEELPAAWGPVCAGWALTAELQLWWLSRWIWWGPASVVKLPPR